MELSKIIAVSLCAVVFSAVLKGQRPEFAVIVTIAAGLVILFQVVPYISGVAHEMLAAADKLGFGYSYLKVLFKITGIAYITEYGAGICRDAGENALATKVEMAGKVVIASAVLPIATKLFETVTGMVP